jgi:uncharacterized protein
MKRVVITGGTGFTGSRLSELLSGEGFEVVHLTRAVRPGGKYKSYRWDPQHGYCDPEAIKEGDTLIHLAGANIGGKLWSKTRKHEIISSRTETADLLFSVSAGRGIRPSAFITASGVNIYGSQTTQNIFSESDPPSDDFLGETCRLWEAAAEPFAVAGIRVVKVRTALVLASRGSALSKLTFPVVAGLVVRFGPGSQYFPWIHIDDLCRIYLRAVTDSAMAGPFNAAAPDHITYDMLMREVARQKRLPVFLPHVPAWLLKAFMGEMSVVLTGGSRISSRRLVESGFGFKFPDISSALRDCLQ